MTLSSLSRLLTAAALALSAALIISPAHPEEDGAGQAAPPAMPLKQAVLEGNVAVMREYLQDNPALVNTKWRNDWMPLHVALAYEHNEVAKLLLQHGAPVNAQPAGDFYGTPLHMAAASNNQEIARLLIEAGADVNIRNGYGELALDKAEERGYGDIAQLLIDAGTAVPEGYDHGITPLHNAIAGNDSEAVKQLLAAGADVNLRTQKSLPPLLLAIEQNNSGIARLLLEHGADAGATYISGRKDDTELTQTLLHQAAFHGNVTIIQLLIDSGADVNAREKISGILPVDDIIIDHVFGDTPLSETIIGDHADAARLLLDNGAVIKRSSIIGETMLHEAATHGALKIAALLLDNGADINATTFSIGAPLDYAHYFSSTHDNGAEMIRLLESRGGKKAGWWGKAKAFIKLTIAAMRDDQLDL